MENNIQRLTRQEMAQRVARDIPDGSYVNLGVGAPTEVANCLPEGISIILHTENGLLGMGPAPLPGEEDTDLINAGKQYVTTKPGAAFFHHADSFGMMRGGHIDFCVLGAFQVSETGDIANWHSGGEEAIPAVGGAMDLAIGAKSVFVLMDLLTKSGVSKLMKACTIPLTGVACVKRVYTDHATFDLTPEGAIAHDLVPGMTFEKLEEMTGLKLLRKAAA